MVARPVGEREGSLKARFQDHRGLSSVNLEVFPPCEYIDKLDYSVILDNVNILTVENKKFERGAKEVIHINVTAPSLNKDSGNFLLSVLNFDLKIAVLLVSDHRFFVNK